MLTREFLGPSTGNVNGTSIFACRVETNALTAVLVHKTAIILSTCLNRKQSSMNVHRFWAQELWHFSWSRPTKMMSAIGGANLRFPTIAECGTAVWAEPFATFRPTRRDPDSTTHTINSQTREHDRRHQLSDLEHDVREQYTFKSRPRNYDYTTINSTTIN